MQGPGEHYSLKSALKARVGRLLQSQTLSRDERKRMKPPSSPLAMEGVAVWKKTVAACSSRATNLLRRAWRHENPEEAKGGSKV